MSIELADAIRVAGYGQLCVLLASALVPLRLQWKQSLHSLPQLLRQLFWIYGGYVVLSITGLGLVCAVHADELANGSGLSRSVCAFAAVFWGVRLLLQPWLAARPYLTRTWLRLGYHVLTLLFLTFTLVLGRAALG